MENMADHYKAVLYDLQQRRSRLQSELAGLDSTIEGIRRLLANQPSLFPAVEATAPPERPMARPIIVSPMATAAEMATAMHQQTKYADMSVRWGILSVLSEAHKPMSTGEISDILQRGGMTTKGLRFASNVSAVLSTMKSERSEVDLVEGGYRLTEIGRSAWEHIKLTAQYRNRSVSHANVQ